MGAPLGVSACNATQLRSGSVHASALFTFRERMYEVNFRHHLRIVCAKLTITGDI